MMINLNFAWTITVLASLIPVLVMCSWIFYTSKRAQPIESAKDLEQCPFCTYLFFKFNKNLFATCPRCQSLISGQEKS